MSTVTPIPNDEDPLYCIRCGEKATVFVRYPSSPSERVAVLCPECLSDYQQMGLLVLSKPQGANWVIYCIWATLFAALIFLAAYKAIELINPPPIPVPVIGERFTEHEKDHLTLLSQVAAQDLLDQSLLPESERDLEGEERIANAMRWAESHSNSPFAN